MHMRDPSNEIIESLKTILEGNVTYNGITFNVTEDVARDNNRPYYVISLSEFEFEHYGTDTYEASKGIFSIEILMTGQKNTGKTKMLNDVSNQVIQLVVDQNIPMVNFQTIEHPTLVNSTNYTEGNRDNIKMRKVIQFQAECREL